MERYLLVNLLGPGPRLMKKEFTGPRSHKGWETAYAAFIIHFYKLMCICWVFISTYSETLVLTWDVTRQQETFSWNNNWHWGTLGRRQNTLQFYSGRHPRHGVKVFPRSGELNLSQSSGCKQIYRNVGKPHFDAAVCPRKFNFWPSFYYTISPLQDHKYNLCSRT